MSWEGEEKEKGWTRREWVKLAMAAGTVGTVAGVGGLVSGQLLPPPIQREGEVREALTYTKFPTPQWWNAKDGKPVQTADFEEWQGATAVWRGVFQEGGWVPGTGFPAIVIRIMRDDTYFKAPDPKTVAPLPEGFNFYYDNGVDTRIVVLFDRCVHLCCSPGWHVVTNPPPGRDYGTYGANPPTWEVFNEDPVYCICHGSQYDPMLLVTDVNPQAGSVPYPGAKMVHGPATRALPLIPVKSEGGNLVGGMADPRWYVYC